MNIASSRGKGLPFIQRQRERFERERRSQPRQITLCPLSGVEFKAPCPIQDCPAHKPNTPQGCSFLWFGRTRLDRPDILFSYSLSEKRLALALEIGQERVTHAIALYKHLNNMRHKNVYTACVHCGVGFTSNKKLCCESIACTDREKFAKTFIQTSYLNFPEMQTTVKDVYLLSLHCASLESLADSLNTNVWKLLSVSEAQYKVFSTMMALI